MTLHREPYHFCAILHTSFWQSPTTLNISMRGGNTDSRWEDYTSSAGTDWLKEDA